MSLTARTIPLLFLLSMVFVVSFARDSESQASAEQKLAAARGELASFDRPLSIHDLRVLKETDSLHLWDLRPNLRRLHEKRSDLLKEIEFWEKTAALKKDLLNLPADETMNAQGKARRIREAESIALTAIRGFGELRKEFGMIRPAALHNIFVNSGIKKEGFCWHWTRELRKRLKVLDLKTYDLLWATAREGTIFENNGLVITSHGKGLEDGVVLDGWRKSGRPFWNLVKQDRYPWRPGTFAGDLTPESPD